MSLEIAGMAYSIGAIIIFVFFIRNTLKKCRALVVRDLLLTTVLSVIWPLTLFGFICMLVNDHLDTEIWRKSDEQTDD